MLLIGCIRQRVHRIVVVALQPGFGADKKNSMPVERVVRTGSSWRELSERFGPWSTVASRYQRWCKAGIWAHILHVLQTGEQMGVSSG